MNKFYFFLLLLSIVLVGCEDLEAPIPAYLTIEDIKVDAGVDYGSDSDKITDAKVFINDQSIGTFELPASVPIQHTGKVNLKIRAGIFNNGQSIDRTDYPFYNTYNIDTTFLPETELRLTPTVNYFSTTKFNQDWSGEDFDGGTNFRYSPASDTSFVRDNSFEALEGFSGLAYLDEDQDFFEARSITIANVPRDGRAVYMEMNYKSTHDVVVSVYTNGQSMQTSIVIFKKRETYTKVYVNLGPVFSTLSGAINYNLAITYGKPLGEIGKLYVDNVKLLQF